MTYAPNIHVAVYQVLDHLITAAVPPPGAKATVHSIIDDLRAASAPRYMIAQAEGISLELHRLESAIRCGNEPVASSARQQLKTIAGEWLNKRIGRLSP
jgi:hypothetical protein